jgi:hypothetical protein
LGPESADDDARRSETDHGHGRWTVFSAKIVSGVIVAGERACLDALVAWADGVTRHHRTLNAEFAA